MIKYSHFLSAWKKSCYSRFPLWHYERFSFTSEAWKRNVTSLLPVFIVAAKYWRSSNDPSMKRLYHPCIVRKSWETKQQAWKKSPKNINTRHLKLDEILSFSFWVGLNWCQMKEASELCWQSWHCIGLWAIKKNKWLGSAVDPLETLNALCADPLRKVLW